MKIADLKERKFYDRFGYCYYIISNSSLNIKFEWYNYNKQKWQETVECYEKDRPSYAIPLTKKDIKRFVAQYGLPPSFM